MDPTVSWTLQIAILATGIYLFLRFLRTTRGGGLLRGLVVAFLIGVVGLWGAAKYFELEELIHIIEGFTPYVAVILVIIFQPELRRGMVRLGQHSRFAQLFSPRRSETVAEVAAAATTMAKKRHGALIGFQRETPLDAWTQNAAPIDAEVSRHLLESIFHPGGALHDGAVVIEGDRVVAAACLFPLTEDIEVSKSTGTRHRAALGLTEETDAITLTVSEETGKISLSRQGRMERDIPPAELEPSLRRYLGLSSGEAPKEKPGVTAWIRRGVGLVWWLFTEDLLRKASAVLLATGLIFIAYQNLIVEKPISLQVRVLKPGDQATPRAGFLSIRLPDESFHLVRPGEAKWIRTIVSGTNGQVARLDNLGGLLDVPPDAQEGARGILVDEVTWSQGLRSLKVTWDPEFRPILEITRYEREELSLGPENVPVDAGELDPRFVIIEDEMVFDRTSIEIEGPPQAIEEIRDGTRKLRLQTISVTPGDRADQRVPLGLSAELTELGISIVGGTRVGVTLPIRPAPHPLGDIQMDIAVVNMDPDSAEDPRQWVVSQENESAQFKLTSAGLFDSDPGTDGFNETYNRIVAFVKTSMKVYVDVSELPDEGGTTVKLHYDFPRDWREKLFTGRQEALAPSATLEVKLLSNEDILLTKKNP